MYRSAIIFPERFTRHCLKFSITAALILLTFLSSFGQSSTHPHEHAPKCATDLLPGMNSEEARKREAEMNRMIYENSILRSRSKLASTTYILPVVVHIIHNGGPENIPDLRVQQAIQHLNEAFSNTGSYTQSFGVNTDIQFCLAVQDESGNLISGITRTFSSLTNMDMETEDLDLKNLIRWDPKKYLNIWVINEINSSSTGSGVAGYAYFPSSHGRPEDGIVVEAQWMGSSTDNSKVLIHEAGHYLGCYHTFEGGCTNNNCMVDGDMVCDSPPDASTGYVACGASVNTCTSDGDDVSSNNPFRPLAFGGLGDQNDMTNNYMDYNSLACFNTFTPGQKDRMISAASVVRISLQSSKGCQSPCTSPITINFTPNATTVFAGQSVTFTGSVQAGVTYNWTFGDGTFANGIPNPIKTYTSTGVYTVTCYATNSDPNCPQEKTWQIKVICPLQASFNASATTIPLNTNLTFTNTSTGGTSTYQWFIDGNPVSTATNLTYSFTTTGAHFVQLVSCNALCCDTSEVTVIQTGNCKVSHAGDEWCFGYYARVKFSGGVPTSLPPTDMWQSEGVASMSDNMGNLLFYTNGQDVWDATHNYMPNGSGLDGSSISAQSSIIVPAPGNSNQYYIFTVHDWQESSSAFRFSVVDMTLNGGKGNIVAATKNTFLQNNIAERVTAVYHKNCKDIWIISHEKHNDRFVAYLLTSTGVNPVPVVSQIGSVTTGGNRYGYLRVSHDSKKLCSTLGGSASLATIELFDFNNETGTVNSPVVLAANGSCSYAYCSEFSPDNRILYVTAYNGNYIYQYDLYAGTPANITASRQNISAGSNTTKPSLQMGPDSKIYVSTYSSLGAIHNPNAIGSLSNYTDNAVPLYAGTNGSLGLPNFIPGLFGNDISITGPTDVCLNAVVTFEASSSACLGDVTWTYHGTGSILSTNDNKITIDVGASTGTHLLKAETATECGTTSAQLSFDVSANHAPAVSLASDTSICGPISLLLDAGPGFTTYNWSNGSTNQTITATSAGNYCVTVTNALGCFATACRKIQQLPALSNNDIIPDQLLCAGKVTLLEAGNGYADYLWNTGATTASISVAAAGKYWVDLTTDNGCVISDTITVTASSIPLLELGPDHFACLGQVVVLDAGPGFKTYQWHGGFNGRLYTAYLPGKYWVTVTDTCGTHSDTVRVVDNCSLPVEILYFHATNKTDHVLLNYKLADVPSGSYAYIQKSYDGVSFFPLPDSHFSLAEQEITEEQLVMDPSMDNRIMYYRLVIQSDQTNTYSQIVSVKIQKDPEWIVTPNPSSKSFQIQFYSEQENDRIVNLYNLEGKLVETIAYPGNLLTIELGEHLNEGIYILSILEEGNLITKRILKIRD